MRETRRVPRPTHTLLRGQVTITASGSRSRSRPSSRQVHAVDDEHARLQVAEVGQVLAPDRTPARARRPSRRRALRASARIGPRPVRRNSISSATRPGAPTAAPPRCRAAISAKSAGDTEYGACATTASLTSGGRSSGPIDRGPTPRVHASQASSTAPRGSAALKPSSSWNTTPPSPASRSDRDGVMSVFEMSPTSTVPVVAHGARRARACRRARVGRPAGRPDARASRSVRIHSSIDAAGGTSPAIQLSSRCVCALTRPGRSATSPRSRRRAGGPRPIAQSSDPADRALRSSRRESAGDRSAAPSGRGEITAVGSALHRLMVGR